MTIIVYSTIHGSKAYGLNNENSDTDIRGIFMPTAIETFGFLAARESFTGTKEADETYWSLPKFFRLASKCNPNAIEILFTNEEDHINDKTVLAQCILAGRHDFLSKQAFHSFGGYARSQFLKLEKRETWDPGIWKDAMHTIRLLDFGKQILTTGDLKVKVPKDFREYLLDVRNAKIPKYEVLEMATDMFLEMAEANKTSKLPEHADLDKLNYWCMEYIRQWHEEDGLGLYDTGF